MQITTVGWQVYSITGRALDLGLVGLAQFLPFLLLFLISGQAADRYSRKLILAACIGLEKIGATVLFTLTLTGEIRFALNFGVLVLVGIARAFQAPAQQAIVPILVPKEHFSNAIVWTSLGFTIGRIAGPATAGFLIGFSDRFGFGIEVVYAAVLALLAVSTILTLMIGAKLQILNKEPVTISNLTAGFRFIWRRQIILGSISLDLFAVLLGGFLALLPIYAKDILGVGGEGYGILRAMPAVGALFCAIYLTQRPIQRHAGAKLLIAVGLFGISIIVFGLSTSFFLSVVAPFVFGATDMVSVFIRNVLLQLVTPDEVRGRVNAVSAVFVGASNELGDTRAGISGNFLGVIPAVVVGGVGTLFVVVWCAKWLPELRRVDSLDPDDLVRKYRDLPGDQAEAGGKTGGTAARS